MKKLLITGFEPFGGQTVNPSWEAVAQLPDIIGQWQLHKLRIPVEYGKAARLTLAKAQELGAEAVLSVGQAGGRSAVTPEVIGIDLREAAIPDNAGRLCKGEPIEEGGPDGIFSTLPVREMAAAIGEKGIPAKLSYSAGAYVCNDVLYTLLRHFEGTAVQAGFIHVPFIPGQGEPNMALEDIVTALTAAIEIL
jgi:pyroglutamyl-peptidase